MSKKQKGEITVFLALLLSVILLFISVIIDNSSSNMKKCESELALEAAVRSCFSEYNKALYDRFHFVLVDTSYKGNTRSDEGFLNHYLMYANASVNNCHFEDAYMEAVSRVKNHDYEILFFQMEAYLGISAETGSINGAEAGSISKEEILHKYVISEFGNHMEYRSDAIREGELEYLLFGMDCDADNIEQGYKDYLEYLESNCVSEEYYLYQDYLNEQIEAMECDTLLRRMCNLINEYINQNGSEAFDIKECIYEATLSCNCIFDNEKIFPIKKSYSLKNLYLE